MVTIQAKGRQEEGYATEIAINPDESWREAGEVHHSVYFTYYCPARYTAVTECVNLTESELRQFANAILREIP